MARLFIFAIGGTGSRVLKSLIMLLAAGHPIDAHEIIPIIIDPDNQNGNLTDTEELLKAYQVVNKKAVPSVAQDGFFRPKISTLADLVPKALRGNNFTCDFGKAAGGTFGEFINYNGLSEVDKKFINTLFSQSNLHSNLDIGFKGNPNVGSIVLSSFENSPEFNLFANVFDQNNDRIFIISSIFGGTGASGFPLLVKLIRNHNTDNLNQALIGAISVGPYFNIQQPPGGAEIDATTFVTKTKAALSYYQNNLHVNALFYLSDTQLSNPYPLAQGGGKQRNYAHLIELIGATSVIKFCQLEGNAIKTQNRAFEYGLRGEANTITFEHISHDNPWLGKSLLFFKYLSHLTKHHIETKSMDLAWARTIGFNNEFIATDTYRKLRFVLSEFETWLKELSDNRRSFAPLATTTENDMRRFITHKQIRNGMIHKFNEDIFDRGFSADVASITNLADVNQKFLALMWKGINRVFTDWVRTAH